MSLNFNKNHPLYTESQTMKDLLKPLTEEYGIHYFQYLRVFDDGSCGLLNTHPEWVDAYIQQGGAVQSHISDATMDKQYYHFLGNACLPEESVQFAKECGIDHGLCMVYRQKDYYDLIAFGAYPESYQVNDLYMNNIEVLHQYIYYLKDQAEVLLNTLDNNKCLLPPRHQDVSQELLLWQDPPQKQITSNQSLTSPKRYLFELNGKPQFITRREFHCLTYLVRGYSLKAIANALDLSPRTIETYLTRAQQRLNCHSKLALIDLFIKHILKR